MTSTDVAERRFSRWLTDADPWEQAAARVLASTLVTPLPALRTTLVEALDIYDDAVVERASEDLLSRPFIERMDDGLRVSEPVASLIRDWFRESDPEGYEAVNRLMLRREEEVLESTDDDEERWFARGRVAFYLAALSPEESAESFIHTFADPPPGDPGPPRSWLTDLVLRQRGQLESEARALHFFQGFEDYKRGAFHSAGEHLEAVLAGPERDEYRAISLHLWSVLRPADARGEDYLREAVELSAELGLAENEVMSRNTLVFRLIARGNASKSSSPATDRAEAALLARTNLARAETTKDRYLLVWCLSAMAQSRWISATGDRKNPEAVGEEEVESLIAALSRSAELAYTVGDFASVVLGVNQAAQIWGDRGDGVRAIAVLEEHFRRIRNLDPPDVARRWAQTAGSLSHLKLDTTARARLQRLRRQLDDWIGSDAGQSTR